MKTSLICRLYDDRQESGSGNGLSPTVGSTLSTLYFAFTSTPQVLLKSGKFSSGGSHLDFGVTDFSDLVCGAWCELYKVIQLIILISTFPATPY